MKLSPDDPKLTAYALGELDSAEAAAVERELKDSAELRLAVEDIRQTSVWLKNEFAAEESVPLEQSQKAKIEEELEPRNIVWLSRYRLPLRIAACFALAGLACWFSLRDSSPAPNDVAIKYAQNKESAQVQSLLSRESEEQTKASLTPTAESVPPPPTAHLPLAGNKTPAQLISEPAEPSHEIPAQVLPSPAPIKRGDHEYAVAKPEELRTVPTRTLRSSDNQPSDRDDAISSALTSSEAIQPASQPPSPSHSSITVEDGASVQTRALAGLRQKEAELDSMLAKNDAKPVSRLAEERQRGEYKVAELAAKKTKSQGNYLVEAEKKLAKDRSQLTREAKRSVGITAIPSSSQLAQKDSAKQDWQERSEYKAQTRGLNFVTKTNHLATINESLRTYLAAAGVDMQPPYSVFFNDRSGTIFVRSDAEEMKLIETALEALGTVHAGKKSKSNSYVTVQFTVDAGTFVENLERKVGPIHRPEKRLVETARYPRYIENNFESVLQNPLSTFSIDVDTASYANARRFLNEGALPPRDAVRVEELINYFTYDYPKPRGDDPFSVNMEVAGCPWNTKHQLLRVGLKGKEIAQDKRPPSNFVFLIDVSGSMSPRERLPLIKQALRMLVKRMTENDRIAMVVYASSSGVVLESTSCVNKEKILEAIDKLEAGGSTNGGEGIQKAYALAEEHFIKGGVNRVILATDGDFNVGITSQDELIELIQRKAKSGVFLSALGVGTSNYKDALLQKLADKGNGNYSYLDSIEEAEKVLIQQMNGTLVTIAKDVKIQIEFNPAAVKSYRLIGYEKRILEAEDFNNDKKDAGEIGAGHTVTALYEIVPAGVEDDDEERPAVDDLKYQKHEAKERKPKAASYFAKENAEMLTLKLRYKKPDGNTSKLSEFTLNDESKKFSSASDDFCFAAAVASFGMLLKDSEYKGDFTFEQIAEVAKRAKGEDKEGYRAEFITLVKKAKELSRE